MSTAHYFMDDIDEDTPMGIEDDNPIDENENLDDLLDSDDDEDEDDEDEDEDDNVIVDDAVDGIKDEDLEE